MSYEQTLKFYPNKMGTRPGWCLMNCRLGFGIQRGCFPSAKADMQSQKNNGTLHPVSSLPSNCAVPVYCDTPSVYEHVVVCDKGVWYEDGKKIKKPNYKFFGWGELCDGVRVVKEVKKKKSNEEVAKEVIQGLWGNGKDRKNRLTKAGYNYDTIQSIVNKLINNNPSRKKSNEEIAHEVIAGKWGNGKARKNNLEKAGYDYSTIQSIVNRLLRK